MPVRIDVRADTDQVIAYIHTKQKAILDAVEYKMRKVLEETEDTFLAGLPGKYIDPKTLHIGLQREGQGMFGYLEAIDKGGTYPIYPVKARALHFFWKKMGMEMYLQRVNRPYLIGTKFIEQHMLRLKPWIETELEHAADGL